MSVVSTIFYILIILFYKSDYKREIYYDESAKIDAVRLKKLFTSNYVLMNDRTATICIFLQIHDAYWESGNIFGSKTLSNF